ncbi:MAG TPA: hypothetical protein VFC07_04090 [Verrucomicrobiae bacterium]|nr:hypothetical protein [Verrucomicrobiae bacterium]
MTKKNFILLSVTFLAVAGFYLYMYRDSFRKPVIQISLTIRPNRAALARKTADSPDADSVNLNFGMDHEYKLTSVRVVPLNEMKTNKYAHAIWELTSDSNSAPTQVFSYGHRIHGMHPSIKGATADPLTPNVPYRLLIEAGPIKGQHDFTISEDEHLLP